MSNFPPKRAFVYSLFAANLSLSLSASPMVTEFLASNGSGLADEDSTNQDWIEIFNPDTTVVDLAGWHLTDDAGELEKWEFPSHALAPGEFVVVFASGKNRAVSGSELHTNFKLKASGEYLALVEPDGVTVAQDFGATYPAQVEDVSYGLEMDAVETALVASGAAARWTLPSSAIPGWNALTFNDTGWNLGSSGFGFENSPADYAGILETSFPSATNSAYLRYPFTVPPGAANNQLSLRVRYDDGFAAWVNDTPAESRNAPANLTYDSVATAQHPDEQAVEFVVFDISGLVGDLVVGENVLAVQSLNASSSSDMLFDVALVAIESSVPPSAGTGFMLDPSPGSGNVFSGPLITEVTRDPPPPTADQDLPIAARVRENGGNALSGVELIYRVGFGAEVALAMSSAGDGIYSATVPASSYGAGDMVRWRVRATDVIATSRSPLQTDTTGQDQSPGYFGTVVQDPGATSDLPILHWFVENPSAALTDAGTRASLFYDGEFYDNLFVRRRGASTASWPKRKFKLDFNKGHHFRYSDDHPRVEEINLQSHWLEVSIAFVRDHASSYMRETAALQFMRDAGVPAANSYHIQLRQNGSFFGLYSFVEQIDDTFLERHGYPVEGAVMYKGVSTGHTRSNLGPNPVASVYRESLPGDGSGFPELQALTSGINENNPNRAIYVHDNLDIPQIVNEMATQTLLLNPDRLVKNYYVYRHPINGEWSRIPWDVEMAFGLDTSITGNQFLTDENFNSPLYGDDDHTQGKGNATTMNHLNDAIFGVPATREMYFRRLRTLVDEFMLANYFGPLVNGLKADIEADADLDDPVWGAGDIDDGVHTIVRTWFLARRSQLVNTYGPGGSGLIPDAQPATPTINFGAIEFNPASGNQDEEYIELTNPNAFAVDVSNWTVSGGVAMTLKPGTVIPAGGSLYLSPNVVAYRSRATSPKGGEGRFVQGEYSGHLSNFGEDLTLTDTDTNVIAQTTTPSAPSDAQRFLVVTEFHYHPAGEPGEEFIELTNVSDSVTLDLGGVRLVSGVTFDFSGMLAPGARVLVVRDQAAFEARYGLGLPVAGEFTDMTVLDNDGETIKIDDITNSTIAEFAYNDKAPWPTAADGVGASLVLVDPGANPDPDIATNWRPSALVGGNPGGADAIAFTGDPGADLDGNGRVDLIDHALFGESQPMLTRSDTNLLLEFDQDLSADDVTVSIETSTDLETWSDGANMYGLIQSEYNGDGSQTLVFRAEFDGERFFVRLKVELAGSP